MLKVLLFLCGKGISHAAQFLNIKDLPSKELDHWILQFIRWAYIFYANVVTGFPITMDSKIIILVVN